MHQPAEPKGSTQQSEASEPTQAQVKKARMLVSMLGADFAKTSRHPFFKDLARTAVRPLEKNVPPPDMSKALANLVRRLADPKLPRRAESRTDASDDRTPTPEPSLSFQRREAEIMRQHPALIAKHLLALPAAEQLTALRKLRGPAARQVAAYLSELRKSGRA
ncbi:hypothetical protein [Litoreibacter janthinus]|uniref:Uncharacterized protein n=1 Tax=Litoreibacter janthinus TaxID=670154 RepID=A0A1I6FUE1_9RHOB|nr:hypothetical protein [Litoreibacter janthinus]SFR33575.1 hypothetical protein SAMN04488002_0346 [Litoreibacter janthinus]